MFQIIFFAFVTLAFIFSTFFNKKPTPKPNLPPGSNGWPLIGETLEFDSNPEMFIHDRMKKYSPKIFKTRVYGNPVVVLCGTAGNKFVATNEAKLFRSWLPYNMQRLFRPSYRRYTLSREEELHFIKAPDFLRTEALVRYVEGMDNIITIHLKMFWEAKQSVNVLDEMERMALALSSRFYLGLLDHYKISKLAHLCHDILLGLHCIPINFPGTLFYGAIRARNVLSRELLLIIKEKKAKILGGKQMNDILSYMIITKAHDGKFISENEICDKIMGLLMGAFSSPAVGLTFIFKFIAERPDIYEKIRQEQLEICRSKTPGEALNWQDLKRMKYSWSVCLEAMRVIPPIQGTFREATTEFEYEGFTIPKGWKVYWTVNTTHKNPECFPNAEEFIGSRFEETVTPFTNVPFGGGPRMCPGKEYARLALLTILHNVVKSFKWDAMYPGEKIIKRSIPLPEMGFPIRLTPV